MLLRAAVAALIFLQGPLPALAEIDSIGGWVGAALNVVAAGMLLAGFLTPIAAASAALEMIGVWISILPPSSDFAHSKLFAGFLTALLAAVVLLGPGAFSVDARLFGLREIIIPRGHSRD